VISNASASGHIDSVAIAERFIALTGAAGTGQVQAPIPSGGQNVTVALTGVGATGQIATFAFPEIIDIVGSYQNVIDIIGSYQPTIDIVGEFG
jgi:hypothetical protein